MMFVAILNFVAADTKRMNKVVLIQTESNRREEKRVRNAAFEVVIVRIERKDFFIFVSFVVVFVLIGVD
jgi:hypothetical protein